MNALDKQPRVVPWSVRLTVLFGSGTQQFCWVLLGIGMIFFWAFAGNADVTSLREFRGQLEQAEGVITASEKSGYSEGGSKRYPRKARPVMQHHYRFELNGATYGGISYSTGGSLSAGQKVLIEFPQGQPAVSRIRGMRRAPFGSEALLAAIFPLLGLGLVIPGMLNGWKACSLLARGEFATGRFIFKKKARFHITKRTVYKLTFQYTDLLGLVQRAETRTDSPEKLEYGTEKRLIYDPLRPARVVFVDLLPGSPQVSQTDVSASESYKSLIASLLPPIFALVVAVGGAIGKLL